MDNKTDNSKRSIFFRWFLNSKVTVFLLNVILALLIIFLFTKVDFVFAPVGKFINVVGPPIAIAAVFYYLMNPVVEWLEKKWSVPKLLTISLLFILLIGLIVLGISLLIPVIQKQVQSFAANWLVMSRMFRLGYKIYPVGQNFVPLKPNSIPPPVRLLRGSAAGSKVIL
ncbi:hypothetical protein JCM14202_1352 [Agrilactobacillus composti DSM 18527 = JCM 14202]|nr:AI-2E family transporter [Agrilactobacillus composti]GAF39487.1 hypothetical protein JCM14202_1352 [Agrilactobacillus composti DSM 18527 = JCM 14202]